MPVFLLSFDLNHADGHAHYAAFSEELGKMRAHRVQNSACLVNVRTGSARALLDHLRQFTEDTDRLFAVRLSNENSFYLHAYPGTNEWIAQNPLGEGAGAEAAGGVNGGGEPDSAEGPAQDPARH